MGIISLHPHLPPSSTEAFILPQLTNESLISIGQLCDNDCDVLFDKVKCFITNNNKLFYKEIVIKLMVYGI